MLTSAIMATLSLVGITELLRRNSRKYRQQARERLLQNIRDIRDEEILRGKPIPAGTAKSGVPE